MKKLKKGLFVVFEGIDGSGKSSAAGAVSKKLTDNGYDIVFLQEPSDSKWGREIKEVASRKHKILTPEEELELFVKDREEDVKKNILPALKNSKLIIMDRYYYSSAAYQGGKGLDPVRIKADNEKFAPIPDLVLIFDCPVDIGLSRIAANRGNNFSYFEKKEYLNKVREIYNSFTDKNIKKIDAEKPLDAVINEAYELILNIIKSVT